MSSAMTDDGPVPLVEPRRPLCRLDDIIEGRGVAALVDGAQIALFRLPGGIVAGIANRDPFTGANVMARGLVGTDDDGDWYVASPLHKQRFRLADGRCLDDPAVTVATYRVTVDSDGSCRLTP